MMICGYEWTADMMSCGYDELWLAVLIDDVLIEGRIDYSGVGEW